MERDFLVFLSLSRSFFITLTRCFGVWCCCCWEIHDDEREGGGRKEKKEEIGWVMHMRWANGKVLRGEISSFEIDLFESDLRELHAVHIDFSSSVGSLIMIWFANLAWKRERERNWQAFIFNLHINDDDGSSNFKCMF